MCLRKSGRKLEIPRYLKMRISVINDQGQEFLVGRDLTFLRQMLNEKARKSLEEDSPGWQEARSRWEREELAGWPEDLPEIPQEIIIDDF